MNQELDYTKEYFTSFDLGLCAAIVTSGFPLDHIDRSTPQKVQFIFQREEGLDSVVQSYWNKSLHVDAFSYFSNVKMLKNRIYSE